LINPRKPTDLSSLRIVLGLDRPEVARRLEALTGATFWAGYAQTETTGFVALVPYFERLGCAGKPGFSAEVDIMDDWGKLVEKGQEGEIVVRGPMTFKGYWNLEKDMNIPFVTAGITRGYGPFRFRWLPLVCGPESRKGTDQTRW
jgi:long-chain acyl-CoA synthetase